MWERETCSQVLKTGEVGDATRANLKGDQLWPVPPSLGLLHKVQSGSEHAAMSAAGYRACTDSRGLLLSSTGTSWHYGGESLSLSLSLSAFMWNNYQERIKSAKQSREHVIAEQQNSMMWKTISRLTLGIRQQHYVDSQAVVAGVCSVEHNLQKQ